MNNCRRSTQQRYYGRDNVPVSCSCTTHSTDHWQSRFVTRQFFFELNEQRKTRPTRYSTVNVFSYSTFAVAEGIPDQRSVVGKFGSPKKKKLSGTVGRIPSCKTAKGRKKKGREERKEKKRMEETQLRAIATVPEISTPTYFSTVR